ncbi:MAG: HPr family phosphocarrier protein [Pseudomonadales bacterium]
MISLQLEIINKLGLHARAAAKFVQTASAHSSQIQVLHEGNSIDGKSIMAVMMLAASKGTILTMEISGPDEQQAAEAMTQLIQNLFGEDE